VQIKTHSPFRVVASLNSSVDSGKVKITNNFNQTGESFMKFEVVKPPKGAEASSTLMYLVIGGIALVILAVIIVALRSRKARVPKGAAPQAPVAPVSGGSLPGAAPKTVAMGAVSTHFATKADGTRIDLLPGANIIGREAHCRIVLTVNGVSREHAKLEFDPGSGAVMVEDLGSTNGTYWGAVGATDAQLVQVTQRKVLNSGESVWIGGERILITIQSGENTPQEG